jgi:hypothetical protein
MSTRRYLETTKPEQTQVDNLDLSIGDVLEIEFQLSFANNINTPNLSTLDNDWDLSHDSVSDVMEGATCVPTIASSNVASEPFQPLGGDAIADFDVAVGDPIWIGFPNSNEEDTIPIDDEPVIIVPASPTPIAPTLLAAALSPADSDEETDGLSLMTDSMPVSPVLSQTAPVTGTPFDDLIRARVGYGLGEKLTKKATANNANDLVTADVTMRIDTIRKVLETLEGETTMKLNYPCECKIAVDPDDGVALRDFDIVNEALTLQKCIAGGGAVPDKGLEHRLNFQVLDYVNLNNIVVDKALTNSQEDIPGSVTLRGLLIKQQCLRVPVNSG